MMKPMERTDGMNSRTRKLTDTDVAEIRRLFREGTGRGELATRFKVSRVQINRIIARERWKCVE